MKCGPAQGKTRRRPRRRSDGGIEAVPTLQGGLGRRMVGEHLNEATISRLGSILECGNMRSHLDCRNELDCRFFRGPRYSHGPFDHAPPQHRTAANL